MAVAWLNRRNQTSISDIQRGSEVYGPHVPRTLEAVAQRAREDPMPLRGPEGGYYGADRHPGILERQRQEFEEAFGEGETSGFPRWMVWALMVILPAVLGGAGFFLAPVMLGLQSGAVQGAGGDLGAFSGYAPWVGLVMGGLGGVGAFYWLSRSIDLGASSRQPSFDMVYAAARITQVEYRDLLGEVCESDTPGARRIPVRRMRTFLLRSAFADRQNVFVPAAGDLKKLGQGDLQRRFRTGEIRLETTRDLRMVNTPHDLYDGRALSGRWRAVNSLRWFVSLKAPLETGLLALRYMLGEEGSAVSKWLNVKNTGVIIGVVCLVVGALVFFAILDRTDQDARDSQAPDRTPAVQVESTPGGTETGHETGGQ